MNNQSNGSWAGKTDEAVDRRIREVLSRSTHNAACSEIENRVSSTIRRRRQMWRASLAGLAVGLLAAASFAAHRYLAEQPGTKMIADANIGRSRSSDVNDFPDFDEADLAPLTAAPPVVSFGLVNSKQVAMLQGLKSLEETRE